MSDQWLMGSAAAQDDYIPVPDPQRRVRISTGREEDPWYSRAATGIGSAVSNVMGGLARDIPAAGQWFLDQARKPEAAAQQDVRNVMGGVADIIPAAMRASEERRLGGEYDAGPILSAAMLGTSGGLLGGTGGEAGAVLTAGQRARRLPPRPIWDESIPPPPMGHNMPPPELSLLEAAPPAAAPAAQPKTWAQGLPRAQPAKRSTDIPSIRGLNVRDAVAIARMQPHLIPAGDQSQGYYVGGPPDIASKRGLTNRRQRFDDYLAADPRGGDWYDRYRTGVTDVTSNQAERDWMSAQEGMMSAGVDPGSELHFALKENNASIAGADVKAARPAQHEAQQAAVANKDIGEFQLGKKTGKYAELINPRQINEPGAVGVNDFRHGENWGFPREGGTAFTDAQHKFLDMETALAVDRANKSNLAGRSDWTGEQLQAAPWVRQKALDIQERGGKNPDGSHKMTYEEAFKRANTTIADFYPGKTAYATFEAQPGSVTGHLPGSVGASEAERIAYAADPRSTWATAPGGRDAIYSGLGIPGTGNYMRVRSSQPMTGFYKNPEGVIETNPGEVARPLVTFDTGKASSDAFKILTPHDRNLLEAGEAFRGYVDAQNASAFHKNWTGGPQNQMNSLYFPRTGKASPAELEALQNKATPYGLNDVVDTGSGITTSSFYPGTSEEIGKAVGKAVKKAEFSEFGEPTRVRTEGGYIDYTDKWVKPDGTPAIGSGEATRHMLQYVTKTPELRAAFNNNPYIAERALAKLERDQDFAAIWQVPREDIQNARRIISEGPGAIDRLEAALKKGAISLPVFGAILAGGTALLKQGGDHEGL